MPPDQPLSKFQSLRATLDVIEDEEEEEDEFERFINARPIRITVPPLEWWAREEQRREYPRLHIMALDLLSIPPLSDKIEGIFSGVRRAIPWERGSLLMETVQKQELMGSWNWNGHLIEEDHVTRLLEQAAEVIQRAEAADEIEDDMVMN
jgi:hypothetical protein